MKMPASFDKEWGFGKQPKNDAERCSGCSRIAMAQEYFSQCGNFRICYRCAVIYMPRFIAEAMPAHMPLKELKRIWKEINRQFWEQIERDRHLRRKDGSNGC